VRWVEEERVKGRWDEFGLCRGGLECDFRLLFFKEFSFDGADDGSDLCGERDVF